MKRVLFFLVLLSMTGFLFAEGDVPEPVPYSADEFPPWLRDVRRAEIILVGSIPVSILFSGMFYSLYRWANNDFAADYAPGIFGSQAARELDEDEKIGVLIVTGSLSGLIALTDFILGKVQTGEE